MENQKRDVLHQELDDPWVLSCALTVNNVTEAATVSEKCSLINFRLLENGVCLECTYFWLCPNH